MIATATINGIAIEINGTPEECYRFFAAHKQNYDYSQFIPWFIKETKCDPFARHYGNCGAEDCPIIDMRIKK